MNVLEIPEIPDDLLKIPQIAALNDRMLYIQQCLDNTPPPEPGFLHLSHTKMRRAILRLRAGKWVPKDLGNLTPEQLADAMERTIAWERIWRWARAEIAEIQRQTEAFQGAVYGRAMDEAIKLFFAGKQLAKEQGPDSDVAKGIQAMKRSWRHDFPRTRKKKRAKGKGLDGAEAASPLDGGDGAAAP